MPKRNAEPDDIEAARQRFAEQLAENSQAQPAPHDPTSVFESDGVYGGIPYKMNGSKIDAIMAGRIVRFPNMEAFLDAANRAKTTPTETLGAGLSGQPLQMGTERPTEVEGGQRALDPLQHTRDWSAAMGRWLASFLRDNPTTMGNCETSRKWDWLFGTWSSSYQRRLIGGGLLIICIWIALSIFSNDDTHQGDAGIHTGSSNSSFLHGHISDHDTLGCVKFEDWQELGQLAKNNEAILGSAALIEKVATHACRIFPVGTSVTVDLLGDIGPLSGSLCVRPEGEDQCLWISMTRMDIGD